MFILGTMFGIALTLTMLIVGIIVVSKEEDKDE